jgi:hypothetical protein
MQNGDYGRLTLRLVTRIPCLFYVYETHHWPGFNGLGIPWAELAQIPSGCSRADTGLPLGLIPPMSPIFLHESGPEVRPNGYWAYPPPVRIGRVSVSRLILVGLRLAPDP